MPKLFFISREKNRHAAGGMLEAESSETIFRYGLSYAERKTEPFDISGSITRSSSMQILLLPIHDKQAERFGFFIGALKILNENNRLPFYFSIDNEINTVFENRTTALNLDGSKPVYLDDNNFYTQHMLINPNGKHITDKELMSPENLHRVRANCMTLLNFIAHLSGIDLSLLDKNWWRIENSQQYTASFENAFSKASEIRTENYAYEIRQLVLETRHRALAVGNEENTCIGTLVSAAVSHFEDPIKMVNFIGSKAFSCDPLPVPEYLQRELDRFELKIP